MTAKTVGRLLFLTFFMMAVTPAVQGEACRDEISGCRFYPALACRAPYIGWAVNNCKRRCGLCNYIPRGNGKCIDKKPNCVDFINLYNNFCSGQFSGFAWDNCRWSCGLCSAKRKVKNSMGPMRIMESMPSMTKDDSGLTVQTSSCQDRIDNCTSYSDSTCESPSWSISNCPRRCNLCEPKPLKCVDKASRCHPVTCEGYYADWARQYCPVTCKLCESTIGPEHATTKIQTHPSTTAKIAITAMISKTATARSTTPVPPTTAFPRMDLPLRRTLLPPLCEDSVSAGCDSIPDSKCFDKMWAIPRCPKRCKICGAIADPCVDTGDCSPFKNGFVLCTGYFRRWAKQYCPVTCGHCS